MSLTRNHKGHILAGGGLSEPSVSRLIIYKRLLLELAKKGTHSVFSHQMARRVNTSPEQIRRDLMGIGSDGRPTRGYQVLELEKRISTFLESARPEPAALVGLGNVGRALLAYAAGRLPSLRITAAFDINPVRISHPIYGCPCHHARDMARVVRENGITAGILAVPGSAAQAVANELFAAGVRNLLNFADARLQVPAEVFVDHVDIGVSLEKFAYFARRNSSAPE
jgi:redox-sensing transcriptional repressor